MVDTKYWPNIRIKELGNGFHVYGHDHEALRMFDKLYEPMKKWCEEHINGRYKIFVIDDGFTENNYIGYSYRFEDESDAVAFKLRWV